MSISFTMTAGELVRQAMVELGVLSAAEVPQPAEMADGLLRLNLMLKSWAVDGAAPWRQQDGIVTFPAGIAVMALTPLPSDVSDMRTVLVGGTERMLAEWDYGEYVMLPNKAQLGSPSVYALRRSPTAVTVTLWPVPNISTEVRYTYDSIVADVADATSVVDVPQIWLEGIMLNLAVALAPMYGLASSPAMSVIGPRALDLKRRLEDMDRPDSYIMVSERYG